jgi:hypothetical protein
MHVSLIFLILSFFSPAARHDFHTSLAEVQYNPAERTLEVSLRVFTDDLETDPFIKNYLSRYFSVVDATSRRKPVNLLGKEITVEVTWLYFEIKDVESLTGKRLQNAVLTELFDDQINMVNFITPSGKRSFLFKPGETVQDLAASP